MPSNETTCRNCGSKELFSKEVEANGGFGPRLLPLDLLTWPTFHIRVCADCGLVEWFVPAKHLREIRRKFPREK